jgi:hypothetical protein
MILLLVMALVPGIAHGQNPDVSVATEDITFDPQEPFVGDEVIITVVIRNSGDPADNVGIGFYLGTDLIGNDLKPVVPASATSSVTWNTSGLDPGDHEVTIKLSASGDTNTTNDSASKTITFKKKPVAVIVINSIVSNPSSPVDGDVANITAELENIGDADAQLNVDFSVDSVDLGRKVLILPKGSKKTAQMSWDTDGKEGVNNITVTAGDAKKTVQVTVKHKPRPDFIVKRVWVSDNEPLEKTKIKIKAEVWNAGDAAETVTIVFKDNVRTIGSKKDVLFQPNETKTIEIDWTARKGERVLRVEVEGYPEATNHETVDVVDLQSRGCGYSVGFVGVAMVVGCVGLVGWKKKKRRQDPGQA